MTHLHYLALGCAALGVLSVVFQSAAATAIFLVGACELVALADIRKAIRLIQDAARDHMEADPYYR